MDSGPRGELVSRLSVGEDTAAGRLVWQRVRERVGLSVPEYRVATIERVQNLSLWRVYQQYCWSKFVENSSGAYDSVNERELFHWAEPKVLDKIIENGFEPRLARAGEYGDGSHTPPCKIHTVYTRGFYRGEGWGV